MAEADSNTGRRKFASPFDIFRAKDAQGYMESGVQYDGPADARGSGGRGPAAGRGLFARRRCARCSIRGRG